MSTLEAKLKTRAPKITPEEFGELPLADALELALRDLEAVEKLPGYRIDMSVFRSIEFNGECVVCLAGAVMDQTLGKIAHTAELGGAVGGKLCNISHVALGYGSYESNPEGFKSYVRQIVEELRNRPNENWMDVVDEMSQWGNPKRLRSLQNPET